MSQRSRWIARTRHVSIVTAALAVCALTSSASSTSWQSAAELAAYAPARERDPRVVTAWNALASEIGFAEDQFLTFKSHRTLAMMHLAMHDALNSIIPVYERYSYHQKRTVAQPVVAAAQAAHAVIVSQYPTERARLDAELAVWLDPVPDTWLKTRGVALGKATAAAILARRTHDGWDTPGTYTFRAEPGQYQTTPPWNGFVAQPGFREARPFGVPAIVAFRPPAPPPLESAAYARALNEVKSFGAAASAQRTADQTAYAIWWMEFAEGSVTRLARELVTERDTPLWTAARLFAHLHMALFDAYVATWDSKYAYNTWRPYTAVRLAADDGNPQTTPEPAWEPMRPTPPHPEYVSAHAAGCAASFHVLEHAFGDRVAFTMTTKTAPADMPSRSFASFDAAAAECADSRVRLGWHFRYATDAGLHLGRSIARQIARQALRQERR